MSDVVRHLSSLERLGQCRNYGERLLVEVANTLVAGTPPDGESAQQFIDAVDSMLQAVDAANRRRVLLEGLDLVGENSGRPARVNDEIVASYWIYHLRGKMNKTDARAAVADENNISIDTVKRHVNNAGPEWEKLARLFISSK